MKKSMSQRVYPRGTEAICRFNQAMGQEALRCMSKVIQPPQERMKGVVLQLPPWLSCCSFTQVIPGCRARQETCLCSGEHDSWLAETHKKSEKSGLKYQRSAKVPKLRACLCQNGQQPGKKHNRELGRTVGEPQKSADLACALLAQV